MKKSYAGGLGRRGSGAIGGGKALPAVERPVYQLAQLNKDYRYEQPERTFKEMCLDIWESTDMMKWLKKTIPIVTWLGEYNWKRDITADIIAGITIAILHIPQGMGFALLGNVPPVIGIYMAIFPVLIYFVLGTSRHINQGTFAVTCLMTGKVVAEFATIKLRSVREAYEPEEGYTNIQVAIAVTFVVAIMELIMYVIRFGATASLLSESVVSGFTCGAAFHVVNSQLKDVFGLPIERRSGDFTIPLSLYDVTLAMPDANIFAVMMSTFTILSLTANNLWFKPWLIKKTRIPFPIELLLILFGIFCIDIFHLEKNHGVTVVGHIPKGFPKPSVPPFDLMPKLLVDSLFIALVSYVTNMSMGLIFARKFMYDMDANQELLALGLSNIVGCFFSCMPMAVSLSRTMIQVAAGGVTQIVSVVSAVILVVILTWLAPFFETLPRCLLATIIVESLKGLIFQFTKFPRIWRLSKWDGLVWLSTFLTTFLISISFGLAVGMISAVVVLFLQGYLSYTCVLGIVPNTDVYLDVTRYKSVREIDGIKIFHFSGGLSFSSRFHMREELIEHTGIDPVKLYKRRMALQQKGLPPDEEDLTIKCIIIDLTNATFIDPSAISFLKIIEEDYGKINITVLMAVLKGPVFETFVRYDTVEKKDSKFLIFPSVHDAVLYAQSYVLTGKPQTHQPLAKEA